MFGLGCVAGAAGIARLARLPARCTRRRRGAARGRIVLADVTEDRPVDGERWSPAACSATAPPRSSRWVIAAPSDRGGRAEVLDSRSHLYPDSQRTMGWDVGATGLPAGAVARRARRWSSSIWATMSRRSSPTMTSRSTTSAPGCAIPGGPKVIEAITETSRSARRCAGADLAVAGRGRQPVVGVGAARAARHHGQAPTAHGSPGVLMAMGPGSAPNSSCCGGGDRGLVRPADRGRRARAARRTGRLQTQLRVELGERGGIEFGARPLPGDGRAARRPAGRAAWSRCRRCTGRSSRPGLADAGRRRSPRRRCAGGASPRWGPGGTPA